ncbi:MAG: vitamin B12-dependent ribonucleotide reductase [candidate division Zixibacteria bacterium]|nr:vitamin B12-dependent ribonucleotide reductase [candidate division Zixibacteria bacterium]
MTETTAQSGLRLERYFTEEGVHPFDTVAWEKHTAVIRGADGKVVFEQTEVEFPTFYSQLAINVVVSKYFRGKLGTPQRETSLKQVISRVVNTIRDWGVKDGYFATPSDAEIFTDELTHLLLYQKGAFNSPVWFNVGIEPTPQCSACFILSVEDTMPSILDWIKTEGMIFKGGSGSGINLSTIRSSREHLAGGGLASGPVSFMRGADATAGAIKSGGKTRRAAKMVVLNVDHPDVLEFTNCKAVEEQKAWALGASGFDMTINGEAWKSIQFQNANNSIRVTDDFMKQVEADGPWDLKEIKTGKVIETLPAKEILRQAAKAAWQCGDPGMQYDTTINSWHTSPNSGRINASNPCSEYMHLDDSACNLASLNIMKFRGIEGEFDPESFKKGVDTFILAMDIIVDNSSYPTERITKNAKAFRELGLGYANLGAFLMSRGLPYDSEEGRAVAASITALLTGEAYRMSAEIVEKQGPFAGYEKNKEPMLNVIAKHKISLDNVDAKLVPPPLFKAAEKAWDEAYALGKKQGYRNSQVSVIAPTGTIAFMMDCDTTGIEPDIALVKYKNLVGGGVMKIVNQTVPEALLYMGYPKEQMEEIVKFIEETGTIEGSPHLKAEHLSVFDCAFKAQVGTRFIHHIGHLKMMGAVQPFISGAISKTVNMPNESTVEEIMDAFTQGWKLGLKALAIYRDGSKRTQPLVTGLEKKAEPGPRRKRLPDERDAYTHKFSIAGHEGYITVGLYGDGNPGEIFITMAKEGSTVSGLMDSFATAISLALQYGVPLRTLVEKFINMRFEPAGFTNNPEIPLARSIMDYIFRWMGKKFLPPDQQPEGLTVIRVEEPADGKGTAAQPSKSAGAGFPSTSLGTGQPGRGGVEGSGSAGQKQAAFQNQMDAPLCADCGMIMVRNGSCYKCLNCGSTSGCS